MNSILQILATLNEGESVTFRRDPHGILMQTRKRNPPRCLCFNECNCEIAQKDFMFSQLMAERAVAVDVLALHLQDNLAAIREMTATRPWDPNDRRAVCD